VRKNPKATEDNPRSQIKVLHIVIALACPGENRSVNSIPWKIPWKNSTKKSMEFHGIFHGTSRKIFMKKIVKCLWENSMKNFVEFHGIFREIP
jgi:hypothetical protein